MRVSGLAVVIAAAAVAPTLAYDSSRFSSRQDTLDALRRMHYDDNQALAARSHVARGDDLDVLYHFLRREDQERDLEARRGGAKSHSSEGKTSKSGSSGFHAGSGSSGSSSSSSTGGFGTKHVEILRSIARRELAWLLSDLD